MATQMTTDQRIGDEYDCVVIGAGPGGSAAATVVADAGHSTLLVEREKMPRFHVGESLMPEVYWTLVRLGALEKMKERGFVKKYGVQFVSHSGKESQPFLFQKHDPRESSTTWHVERADFDEMLFENAREKGAHCIDETRVLDVELQQPNRKVTIRKADGTEQSITTKVVVDATGQQSFLASRLGLKIDNPDLHKAGIWTYYRGAERPSPENNATIILHTNDKKAWFWYIPLKDNIVSVGVVGDNDYMLKGRGSAEEVFSEELEKCLAVKSRVSEAEQIGKYHVAKEFSYTTKQHAGEGWVLVGDAYGFIDPIYSSGVFLALKSGELAGDAIVSGLANKNLSGEQLGSWANHFNGGSHWIRKLVHAFYTNEFSFGGFMKKHPEHQGNLTDLLIGRVFHESAGDIFADMDRSIEMQKVAAGS